MRANVILNAIIIASSLVACTNQNHYVVATSATVIGVELSQNPATQTPQAKLGYNRAELAIVPTNRSTADSSSVAPTGAEESPDVLMELRYDGIFAFNEKSGIYQRLAVGTEAVSQPGAAAMFLRDAEGKVDPAAVEAIKEIPQITARAGSTSIERGKLAAAYVGSGVSVKQKYDAAAKAVGYVDFVTFVQDETVSVAKMEEFKGELANQGVPQ